MTLKGGSAAEPERGFQSPFFQTGVKSQELRSKEVYRFRILPAFDDNLNTEDPAFKTSFIPYRDANLDKDPLTKTEGFTSWYFVLSGYSFLGRQQKGFLSPANMYKGRPHAGLDPIIDCRDHARKHADPIIKAYTERPTASMGAAVIPDMRRWSFFNAYKEQDDGTWVNYILFLTHMGMDDLKKKLSIKGGRNDKVITEAWEDYLYGDVTDPMTGLIGTSKKAKPGDNIQGIETSCIFFSKKVQSLEGCENMPIDPETDEGRAILEGRYAIGDDTNVLKIATYEEMLNYIVEDGTIPYSIIQEACSEHANVPAEPARARAASYSTPPPADEDPAPGPGGGSLTSDKETPADLKPAAKSAAKTTPGTARATVAPPPATTAKPAAAAASTAKPHGALKSAPTGAVRSEPTEEGRARYEALVAKVTNNPSAITPVEIQELTRMAPLYQEAEAVGA